MKDFTNNLIQYTASVIDAMQKLNDVPKSLTLFVLDSNSRLCGTLTDGDIRRGFIKGLSLEDPVSNFMSKSFHSVQNGFTLVELKHIRDLGIRLLPVLNEDAQIVKVFDLKRKKSILPLECVIMAGGRGERLRPLTDTKPKPMLPLGGKPILEHNIDRLISYGIEKIYISLGYLGEQISDYFGDGSDKGISIEYIWEESPLGTAGALSLVKNFATDHVLLMNSDLFTDVDFEDLYLNVIEQQARMGVATIPHTTSIPYGIFKVVKNEITGIKEKPIYTNYANAGIYILETKLITKIPYNKFFNITDLIEQIITEKGKVIHNPIIGYWIDIGQQQDYHNAQEIINHLRNDW